MNEDAEQNTKPTIKPVVYAILRDGVYEGVEHYRGQKMAKGCEEMVNFEFTKPDGHQWRGEMPASRIFKDREAAQVEWDRLFA